MPSWYLWWKEVHFPWWEVGPFTSGTCVFGAFLHSSHHLCSHVLPTRYSPSHLTGPGHSLQFVTSHSPSIEDLVLSRQPSLITQPALGTSSLLLTEKDSYQAPPSCNCSPARSYLMTSTHLMARISSYLCLSPSVHHNGWYIIAAYIHVYSMTQLGP